MAGDLVEGALEFLEDRMFSETEIVFLEHVSLSASLTANIYISATESGLCVILMDVTSEFNRIKSMQQTGNELCLCRERLRKVEQQLQQSLQAYQDRKSVV